MLSKNQIYAFVKVRRLGVVSTIGFDGRPQSALVGIAISTDLEIIFDTTDVTRKCANLRRDPRVALVTGWEGEQTLQLEGVADEPKDEELARLKKIYFATYPDGPEREGWPGITYFRIRPHWARYSNYDRPARVEESTLS